MQPEERDVAYLWDMLDAARTVTPISPGEASSPSAMFWRMNTARSNKSVCGLWLRREFPN